MKPHNIEKIVWSVFFSLGLFIFIVGTIACIYAFDYSDKIETMGTITEIRSYGSGDSKKYLVYVSYEVDGIEHESKLNGYSFNFREGQKIKIYYDKNDPSSIGSKSLNFLFLMFPGMGLIFGIIGGWGLIYLHKKKNADKKLINTGRKIYASYKETIVNHSCTYNGKHPFILVCEWQDPVDGTTHLFKSKDIWFNPKSKLSNREDVYIPVYIDDDNKSNYVVDIESLFDTADDIDDADDIEDLDDIIDDM